MTLEQRVEVLEMAIANMVARQRNADELNEMSRNCASKAIEKSCCADGVINAAQNRTAKYESGFNISIN